MAMKENETRARARPQTNTRTHAHTHAQVLLLQSRQAGAHRKSRLSSSLSRFGPCHPLARFDTKPQINIDGVSQFTEELSSSLPDVAYVLLQ